MPVPIPNLDNRTYEQLLDEARKSIPNYAPEWTNHNPADPGITLIELFAWLAEITSYRINLVTEEHLRKYLKLLGIRPQGFLPAVADLCFKTEKTIHLKKGTVFLAEKAGEIIEYMLSEDITVVPVQLEKIIINDFSVDLSKENLQTPEYRNLSRGIFDRSIANKKEDLFFAPFGLEAKKESKIYLGFKLNAWKNGIKDLENSKAPEMLDFMCYLYEKELIKPGKHGEEEEYEFENAKLRWDIFISSDGERSKEVHPVDGTRNFTKSGSLLFTDLKDWVPSTISILPSSEKEEKYFWLCCTLLESEYEYPPRIQKISLNTRKAIQKKLVKDSKLGESTGLPEQIFKLLETPVLRGSLKLKVGGEIWDEVEDFDSSGPQSHHFTLESLKGEIRFGDGTKGEVPRASAEIRVSEYEISKGENGNLPAGSMWTAEGIKLDELTINNLKEATGGKDEESVAEALEHFIKDLRVPYRAVTSADFEHIARETPGLRVAQAKAIPNFDPYTQTERAGSITVVIVPFSPLDTFEAPPEPSLGFKEAVARHLEKHRLLGTHVYVVSPEYVQVEVTVMLSISKSFHEEKIKTVILHKLSIFLHPAKGGIYGKGWPIGKPVYLSEIYQLIMETEGIVLVKKINICAKEGAKTDENGDLILASKISTVYSGDHSVEVLENHW